MRYQETANFTFYEKIAGPSKHHHIKMLKTFLAKNVPKKYKLSTALTTFFTVFNGRNDLKMKNSKM